MELLFPVAMRLNGMDALAACCHFSTFIVSSISARNRSIYKSTRERVGTKGLHG